MRSIEWRPRNVKVDLFRLVATGLGSVVGLTVAGWPSQAVSAAWAGFIGALLGFGLALAIEYAVRLHREVDRLEGIESTAEADRRQHVHERELLQYQLLLANRKAAVAEVGVSVWGGLFNEQQKGSANPVPVSVVMARHEVELKARGLDKPPPPAPQPPGRD